MSNISKSYAYIFSKNTVLFWTKDVKYNVEYGYESVKQTGGTVNTSRMILYNVIRIAELFITLFLYRCISFLCKPEW